MKSNLVVVVVVVVIGVLLGVSFLFGIGNAVQMASLPLVDKMQQMVTAQVMMERKIDQLAVQAKALQAKLDRGGNAAPVRQVPQMPTEDFDKAYNIPVGNSIIVGKKDAPVTITEFSDLQCPFCARFFPPVEEALKAYPDKVRYIMKNFPLPFHPNARPAAKLALAANEQGKYIQMVKLLLENGADVSEAKVKDYAKQAGLNYDRLMADAKNKDAQYEQRLKEDADLIGPMDVHGTPTFFINGKKTAARDFNAFKAEIDKLLAQK